jgi:hypothetical protein
VQQGAPDLGPGFTQVKDGISVFVPDQPTTTKIFDEYEGYYTLLMKRVGEMAAKGRSLDQIKKELKMPEYADWNGQDRLGVNIDAAYKSVMK